ncbi:MAG: PDZ domain-containing protein [Phaeodactylibacter sp.]|nr:PDZ domain-containing protein [Phaeodactylibacter sp.]
MKTKWTLILALAALLPGLLLAQEEPEKGKQKIVVIKKSVDENGNKVVEKIVREADGDEKLEWKDESGHVIIKLGKDNAEWESLDDIDIELDGLGMELEEHLEGLDEQLRNIEVEVDELEDGMKNLKIRIEPDGEVIEWQGLGGLPEELEQRLEQKGLHFRSLEGEDFTFPAPPNKALLGVKIGQEIEMAHENGDVEKVEILSGKGTAVLEVFEGSAAEEAGIRKGDIITSVDEEKIGDYKALVEVLGGKAPGDKVLVGLDREGQAMVVEAILKGRDSAPFAYEFKLGDDGRDIHFFSDEGKKAAGRHKVIILKDGDLIMEREDEHAPEPGETRPALELEAFEAFPNPADNELTVRFTGEQAPVTIRLLDAAGQQVYKEYIQDFEGRYDQRIGLQGIPEGLLLLTVEQEGRVFTEKVMIARQ